MENNSSTCIKDADKYTCIAFNICTWIAFSWFRVLMVNVHVCIAQWWAIESNENCSETISVKQYNLYLHMIKSAAFRTYQGMGRQNEIMSIK